MPAVILASRRGSRLEIHLLRPVLSHVRDPQIAGLPVERVAPGASQAHRPYLRTVPRAPHKGIGMRHGIRRRPTGFGVDAQHLAPKLHWILGGIVGIARASAVSRADI